MSHVVIVGAGPAGASLAFLLSHRGVQVTLLERRRDFDREFRGEVLMPSGVAALEQMGCGELLARIPAVVQRDIAVYMNGRQLLEEHVSDEAFRGRPPLAISQPAFLEAMVEAADDSQRFTLLRGVAVRELVKDNGRVTGVRLRTDDDEQIIGADLVVGADGRNSAVRRLTDLRATPNSPPMDIVWCKIPLPSSWRGARAYAGRGHLLFAYHAWDDHLQLGWVILKGTFGELRSRGIEQWIEQMAHHVDPPFAEHLRAHAATVQKPFLLDTAADCVARWSVPGALVIGDAAHTMSPVAAQGVNVALRDAIVAANHLVPALTNAAVGAQDLDAALAAIEGERMPEIRKLQHLQAQPPKLMLSRAWWGEPLRRLAAAALSAGALRPRIAANLSVFPFGVTEVRLRV